QPETTRRPSWLRLARHASRFYGFSVLSRDPRSPNIRAKACLEEAGDKLFTFTRFPKSQWKSIRTSNAIERLHEEFKRRIKTQTVLRSAETAAMLFWALMASGQITMRKVDGWQSLVKKPSDQVIDLAA
ncbi:MAG: transposase, partial [Methylocella sp.]